MCGRVRRTGRPSGGGGGIWCATLVARARSGAGSERMKEAGGKDELGIMNYEKEKMAPNSTQHSLTSADWGHSTPGGLRVRFLSDARPAIFEQ